MATKIFVIGDPHFKTNNIEECNLMCDQIIDQLDICKPDAVVCLGDVLDRHETIHVGPLLRSIQFFEQIESKYKLYILIGNHDRPNNQVFMTDEHPFTALKLWQNTTIVDKTFEDRIGNHSFVFVPYVPPGRFMEALENTNFQNARAIFAHQEFYGAKMGMTTSIIGDKWDINFPLVVSGHIHDFQSIQDNIIYTGTPLQHAYGDNEDKGVFLFNFLEESSNFNFEKIVLDIPKKKIVHISANDLTALKSLDPKCHYKIIISGTPMEIKSVKIQNFVKHLQKYKIAYHTNSTCTDTKNFDLGNKNFLTLLYEEILTYENQQMNQIYEELFGRNRLVDNREIFEDQA